MVTYINMATCCDNDNTGCGQFKPGKEEGDCMGRKERYPSRVA